MHRGCERVISAEPERAGRSLAVGRAQHRDQRHLPAPRRLQRLHQHAERAVGLARGDDRDVRLAAGLVLPLRRRRGLDHMEAGAAQGPLHPVGARRNVPDQEDAGRSPPLSGSTSVTAARSQNASLGPTGTAGRSRLHPGWRAHRPGPRPRYRRNRDPGLHQDAEPVAGAGPVGRDLHRFSACRGESGFTGYRRARFVPHKSGLAGSAVSLRSIGAFKAELERCRALKIRYLVSHPGNYIDDRDLGLSRNAAAYATCLAAVPGRVMVLWRPRREPAPPSAATSRSWPSSGPAIPAPFRRRIGFCADTCHLYAAGYDLVRDFDGVWDHWERVIGLRRLRCMHLNDSKTPFGSRRDRHELIGEGTLGPEPFRRVMTDPRFDSVIKILETPKGNDGNRMDRKMLRRLRGYGRSPGRGRSVA